MPRVAIFELSAHWSFQRQNGIIFGKKNVVEDSATDWLIGWHINGYYRLEEVAE